MSDRQGIEIDYCPKCRGVWLDRGELDKLIERSSAQLPQPQAQQQPQPQPHYREHDDYRHKRKRKGLLGEIFDFD